MKKFAFASALVLASSIAFAPAASAHHDGSHEGYTCPEGEASAVTGKGPAASKDRNDNLWVCLVTNPKNGRNVFVDDVPITAP